MVYFLFIASVIVTVVVAVKLSKYADIISKKSMKGGAFLGAVLLGGATSLPEITTSYTAAIINNPDLILGNILGSNLFNMMTLAFINIYFIKRRIFQHKTREHVFTTLVGLILSIYLLVGLHIKSGFQVFGIGLDSILLLVGYGLGMFFLSRIQVPEVPLSTTNIKKEIDYSSISMKRTVSFFIFSCFLIMAFGTILTVTGDRIGEITGLGSSFVGMFMIAITTSLPEVVSCIVAVRLGNPGLAIGSVLGSNLFNLFVLGSSDIFYRGGLLLSSVELFHYISTITLIIMNLIVLYTMLHRTTAKQAPSYLLISLAIIALYIANSIFLFVSP
ncbi:sodium:calcium antiporter [Sutcliffiella horikoshii]|uniref:sodium:calcium antiporter n=1 Tax=Sutcliffiella horikoshii TaxID=79883 RepID=UPI0007D05247|nr:sodium:calcium antiporter [Sutcliffiella horikoshii]MCM3617128.1 sodium:calcium antiporter [Sutcliffiella horikoshii]